MLRCGYKLWIRSEDGHKIFGEGPYLLLKGVEQNGSLLRSAQSIHMSYSKAFLLIKNAEKEFGFYLLTREVGGKNGGGSKLTPNAKELLEKYEEFQKKAGLAIERIYLDTFCR